MAQNAEKDRNAKTLLRLERMDVCPNNSEGIRRSESFIAEPFNTVNNKCRTHIRKRQTLSLPKSFIWTRQAVNVSYA